MNTEHILEDASKPGVELLHLQGAPGYQDEFLLLSNGLINGLRFEIRNEIEDDGFDHSGDWMCFHIANAETAKLIAARLLEWAQRIAEPLAQPDSVKEE
jgi:hypothetical protein